MVPEIELEPIDVCCQNYENENEASVDVVVDPAPEKPQGHAGSRQESENEKEAINHFHYNFF